MADPQILLRDGPAATAPTVSLDAFAADTNATAVVIQPGEDARVLLAHLDRLALVEVTFPAFTDGRGFSTARILREAGYKGELRASGDIGVDMLTHLQRCGFDAIAPKDVLDADQIKTALATWPQVYQATVVDGRKPIWALRHGQ
ncbi:DUF934 domain-containing protein [Novosphingobium umbonatum]|uniref:DUF934 domain-containing protein n=1 Tax=Novosphingobium umbonatum TaxID=1908524 RepID=A0A3S2UXC3_9SPHN|nr:DUF934 domain-containing protein [Novosphingobium umbonatum]RVU07593.1 DUF934 domain-containing protein [Novosphingobium umbonatum]